MFFLYNFFFFNINFSLPSFYLFPYWAYLSTFIFIFESILKQFKAYYLFFLTIVGASIPALDRLASLEYSPSFGFNSIYIFRSPSIIPSPNVALCFVWHRQGILRYGKQPLLQLPDYNNRTTFDFTYDAVCLLQVSPLSMTS